MLAKFDTNDFRHGKKVKVCYTFVKTDNPYHRQCRIEYLEDLIVKFSQIDFRIIFRQGDFGYCFEDELQIIDPFVDLINEIKSLLNVMSKEEIRNKFINQFTEHEIYFAFVSAQILNK